MASILFAEDNTLTARVVASSLRRAGIRVAVVGDGESVLRELVHEVPDLVVTDIGMPVLDGIRLMHAVRQLYPGLPVVALTGLKDLVQDAGFDAVVDKPCDPDVLLAVVLEVLSKGGRM